MTLPKTFDRSTPHVTIELDLDDLEVAVLEYIQKHRLLGSTADWLPRVEAQYDEYDDFCGVRVELIKNK